MPSRSGAMRTRGLQAARQAKSFSAAAIASGWTLFTDSVIAAGKRYMRCTPDQGYAAIWCGVVVGGEAYASFSNDFGTPAQLATMVRVTVDGYPASLSLERNPTGNEYRLFKGLADAPHFVTIQMNPGLSSYVQWAWQPTTGNVMRVIGANPDVRPAGEWSQLGDSAAKGIGANGLIATASDGQHGAGRVPLLRADTASAYHIGSQGCMAVRTDATELWVVCQSRYAFVYDGVTVRSVNTGTAAGSGSNNVRVARFTGLAAGLKTLFVCAGQNSNNPQGGWFSVGVPFGSTFTAFGTALPQAHIFGDSITQGVNPSGLEADNEFGSGQTDAIRSFWKQGYVPGNFGISGTTFAAHQSGQAPDIATQLSKLTVGANDVAYVALGQNALAGAPTSAEVTYVANQLLTKGYRRVIFRGVLPLATDTGDAAVTAKNNTIQSALTAIGDAKLKYIDPMGWTDVRVGTAGIRTDGIHFTVAGYDLLMARMDAALPGVLA